MATLASLVVMPGRRDSTAVLTRFLLWGGAVFLAASRGSARDWKKYAAAVLGTTAVAALVQPLHAIGDVGLRGSVAIVAAAGIEEVVFRALLPRAFAKLVEVSQRRDALTCSVPLFVAQLAFAATHLTLSGGLANRAAETEFVRLFGCGCCLATVYLFGGLVPAIIVHAFSNLIVLNPGPWQGSYPQWQVVIFFTALAAVILFAAVMRTDDGLQAFLERRGKRANASISELRSAVNTR